MKTILVAALLLVSAGPLTQQRPAAITATAPDSLYHHDHLVCFEIKKSFWGNSLHEVPCGPIFQKLAENS